MILEKKRMKQAERQRRKEEEGKEEEAVKLKVHILEENEENENSSISSSSSSIATMLGNLCNAASMTGLPTAFKCEGKQTTSALLNMSSISSVKPQKSIKSPKLFFAMKSPQKSLVFGVKPSLLRIYVSAIKAFLGFLPTIKSFTFTFRSAQSFTAVKSS